MAKTTDEKETKKKKAPKPPPKPSRTLSKDQKPLMKRKPSREKGAMPLKKRNLTHENHIDDYPRYRAKTRSQASREEEDPCFTCLRTSVHCYNIIILILGLGVLGIGIWLLVTEYSVREVSVLIGSNLFEIGTYLMIAGGGTIALLAFCGCCGTMREDRCVLAFYGVTLTVVLLSLIGGSALAFIFRSMLSGHMKDKLLNTLTTQYGVDIRRNANNRLVTDAWDSMQRSLHCCGAYGNINDSFSWAAYKLHSEWYTQTNSRAPYVPDSCCRDNKPKCDGREPIDGPPTKGPPMKRQYEDNDMLYTDGCYEKVIFHLEKNALILGAVAAGVPLLLIVGIVIVFCMCVRVQKSDDELDGDDV